MALTKHEINNLKVEFYDQQLWQFITVDEWLDAHDKNSDHYKELHKENK